MSETVTDPQYLNKTLFEYHSTIEEYFEMMDTTEIVNYMKKGNIEALRQVIETLVTQWEKERSPVDQIHKIESETAIDRLVKEKDKLLNIIMWCIVLSERIDTELYPMYQTPYQSLPKKIK